MQFLKFKRMQPILTLLAKHYFDGGPLPPPMQWVQLTNDYSISAL